MRSVAVGAALLCASLAAAQTGAAPSLLARGDSAWEARDRAAALAAYGALVRADSTAHPRALLRLGTLHAWAGRSRAAIACHSRYVAILPDDADGRLALARSFAWAGHYALALTQYDALLARDANSSEAVLGRATVLAWSGEVAGAIGAIEGWERTHRASAQGAVLRARFLAWQGRATQARVLHDSLRPHRDSFGADLREQWQWVEADARPATSVRFTHAEDSEQNLLDVVEVTGRRGLLRAVTGDANVRLKRVGRAGDAADAIASTSAAGALTWQPGARAWSLRVEAGAITSAGSDAPPALLGGVSHRRPIGARGSLALSASRSAFDDIVSAADSGAVLDAADLLWTHRGSGSRTYAVELGVAEARGAGAPNGRRAGALSVEQALPRGMRLRVSHREISWVRAMSGTYFAPQRLALTEASFRRESLRERGLLWEAEVGVGAQSVRLAPAAAVGTLAPRIAGRLLWRAIPGREIVLGAQWAASAGVGTLAADGYRAGSITLGARWVF